MSARQVLQSWKDISAYLGRDIRTCRRWEEKLGLPVHRLNGSAKARVMAYKDEIDRWLEMKLHEREVVKPNLWSLLRHWPVAVFTGILVVGVLGWRSISNGRPHFISNGGHPALAVLPFVNSTGDPGLDYLCESVPDHLILNLQRSADQLTVFSFDVVADAVRALEIEPGKPLTPNDLAAIASRTGAGWLLAGYVSKAGSKIRVDYELREAMAAEALRTDHVPGTEMEMPVIEDRVCDDVRRVFGVPTSSSRAALLACSVQATRFYEPALAVERRYVLSQSPAELEQMIGLFEQARKADPGCALAVLGLGDAYQYRFVYEGMKPDSLARMNEYYRTAYEMAPERAETNVGMGWVQYFRRENDQAYAYLKKAMELDPSSLRVLLDVGSFLAAVGILERSTVYFSRVIRAGGGSADVHLLRAWSYEQMGYYESALADFDRMIELEPGDCWTRCYRARVLVLMKRYDAAAAELSVAETLAPGDPHAGFVRALVLAARGDKKAALAAIAPALDPGRPTLHTYYLSRVYAALGMKEQALGNMQLAIDKCFDDTHDYVYFFPFLNNTRDYFYDKLRGEPRFAEILRREERKHVERLEKYSGL
jgi:tetratricopeptide (TPR) repeat protein/TolB-like protein